MWWHERLRRRWRNYKAGSERALNYIVGQVMKKTRGKASPGEVHNLVRAQVDKL